MNNIKKAIAIILFLLILFSLPSCALYGRDKKEEQEIKEKYEQALSLLDEGKEIDAYRLLYQVKEYSPAKIKINEMLANDFSLQYRAAELGYTVKFGRCEQDNDITNGSEDIEWTVIKSENGKLMLLANKILDCQKYYTGVPEKNYTWADSYMCAWLNGDFFLNSFLEGERDKVCITPITTYEPYLKREEISNCKVFLLSLDEYYAFSHDMDSPAGDCIDQIEVSDYAKYLYKSSTGEISGKTFALRNMNEYGVYCLSMNSRGVASTGYSSGMIQYFYVRPVIWIEY